MSAVESQDTDSEGVNDSDSDSNQVVKMVIRKPIATTPTSILIGSLVKNLCTMIESDEERALKVYNIICNKLYEMKLIDESYQMTEFEGIRSEYQRALYRLVTVARGGEEPIPIQQVWPNESIGSEWSHYKRDFEEIEFIAGGGFGQVFRVRHKLDGTEYAIKRIYIRANGIQSVMNYLAEVKTFASLNHSNIVQYKAAWLELGIPATKKAIEVRDRVSSDSYSEFATNQESTDFEYVHAEVTSDGREGEKSRSSEFTVQFETTKSKQYSSCSSSNSRRHRSRRSRSRISISEGGQAICRLSFDEVQHETRRIHNESSSEFEINPPLSGSELHAKVAPTFEPTYDFGSDNIYARVDKSKQYSSPNSNSIHNQRTRRSRSRISVSEGGKAICKFSFKDVQQRIDMPEQKWATLFIQMALCQINLKQWLEKRNLAELPEERGEVALVRLKTQLRRDTVLEILKQVLKGLQYIHSKGIVHHDIKPSNIFMQMDGGVLCVQLGDFGLACPLQKTRHSLAFGTKLYAAPEQLAGKCDPKSDMYSLGIVLLELVETFRTDMERVHHITELRKGRLSSHISAQEPQLAHIISQLVSRYPHTRPDASQLLERLIVPPGDSDMIRDLKSRLAEKDIEISRLKEMLKSAGVDV